MYNGNILYFINSKTNTMSYELNTIRNTKKTFGKNKRFLFEDFLIACPFSIEYLRQKNRKQEVMQWRQIGMSWYAMEFNSLTEAGSFFRHNHSTVVHSLKCVQDRKWNPSLDEKVNKIVDLIEQDIEYNEEIGMREVNSLMHLEKLIRTKLAFVEK
jgi:hypothetical protein